ncbi:FdhC protein [Clostridia bacterium]|nr:FdhC protein [Clostridia bacterium]
MNLFSAAEVTQNYINSSGKRVAQTLGKIFVLAVFAGFFIACGGMIANTAAHTFPDSGQIRLVSGLLFPVGLIMVVLTGAELFTGAVLLVMPLAARKVKTASVLRLLAVAYAGNFIGAILLAAGCALFGQLGISGGGLAVYTIKVAAAKCALSFPNALVSGFFCNALVCVAVLLSLTAKDTIGKIAGAYVPIAIFVIAGLEHSIANMFYIGAGLFALPRYGDMAIAAGIDLSGLTWGAFLLKDLLPVTIGNILGGLAVGLGFWYVYATKPAAPSKPA